MSFYINKIGFTQKKSDSDDDLKITFTTDNTDNKNAIPEKHIPQNLNFGPQPAHKAIFHQTHPQALSAHNH